MTDTCTLKVKIDDPVQKIFSIFMEGEDVKKSYVTWNSIILTKDQMKLTFSKMKIKDGDKLAVVCIQQYEQKAPTECIKWVRFSRLLHSSYR